MNNSCVLNSGLCPSEEPFVGVGATAANSWHSLAKRCRRSGILSNLHNGLILPRSPNQRTEWFLSTAAEAPKLLEIWIVFISYHWHVFEALTDDFLMKNENKTKTSKPWYSSKIISFPEKNLARCHLSGVGCVLCWELKSSCHICSHLIGSTYEVSGHKTWSKHEHGTR